jgi:hypothetical protein
VIDRLLERLGARWLRRGLAGDPLLLALGLGTWVVRRARRSRATVVWSGRLSPGERLVLSAWSPGEGPPAPTGA